MGREFINLVLILGGAAAECRPLQRSRAFVDDLAVDDGHHAARLQYLGRGDGHDVGGEYGQVCEFSDLYRAAQLLFKRRLSRPDREHL
jgi:hypothetical protein